MDQLDGIFNDATSRISHDYFNPKIAGGPPVWRERVYCYELYHQMRALWPEDCSYGRVERDSNAAERTIRPIALNCKSALLAGHDTGDEN